MKKFAKKSILRSLASACFVGTSCCSAALFGQQLVPLQKNTTEEALPPIVSGSKNANQTLPPIIRKSSSTTEAAPVVSVNEMMNQPGMVNQASAEIQKGKNFPTDGERRIAEFIRSSAGSNAGVAQAGFGAAPQEYTPGDEQAVPVIPVPVPDVVAPHTAAPHSTGNAPSIGGQAYVPGPENSVMQPAPQIYNAAPVPQSQYVQPGTGNYFQPAPAPVASPVVSNGYDQSFQGDVVDYGDINSTFDCCGFICDARSYLVVDALYWEREDGVFRASNIANIDDLDHSWGGRITYGTKRDSMRGIEASYMQLEPLLAVSEQRDGGTLFGALFGNSTTGDLPNNAFTSYRNGVFAQQIHKSRLHSAELNRTWWGSDVAKAFIGARYIHFDDEFRLSMTNAGGELGAHLIDTTNNMFGLHIGGEMLYDIGYRLSFSFGAKLGGYANFSEGSLVHINNSTVRAFNSNTDTDFAWSGEFGAWARYKVNPNVRLRVGYELLGLYDVKDVESAFSTVVQSTSGRNYPDGEAAFHGPSFGFEIYR